VPAAAVEPDAVTLTIDNLIHAGTNSSIFLGRRHDDHQFLVTKLYDRTRINSQPELADRLLNERRLLEAASKEPHAFIVGFKCALVAAQAVCICMENVGGGDLFTLLERHGPFAPEHARIYVGEVALAVGHLHALDIIHRSLTTENILVTLDGHLKLADFASAKQMLGRVGSLPPPRAQLTLIGTPSSIAPEVLEAKPACEEVDWWSVGVLACELLSGRNPFEPDDGSVETLVRNVLVKPITPPTHAHIGSAETAFLSALLTRDPNERLGSRAHGGHAALFEHPWFTGVTAYSLLTKQAAAPWLPYPNGPAPPAPPPPTPPAMAELVAMAAQHAQGTPPPPPAEWVSVGFAAAFGGQPAIMEVVKNNAAVPVEADVPVEAVVPAADVPVIVG